MSRPALIVGGDSRLGLALRPLLLDRGFDVYWTQRHRPEPADYHELYLDLAQPDLIRAFRDVPHVLGYRSQVFIVAAVTGFGPCERGAVPWRVNADAPGIIARACASREEGAHVVFVSSDAVEFALHTAYGKQKAYAELAVLAAGGSVLRPGPIADRYGDVAEALLRTAAMRPGALVCWP